MYSILKFVCAFFMISLTFASVIKNDYFNKNFDNEEENYLRNILLKTSKDRHHYDKKHSLALKRLTRQTKLEEDLPAFSNFHVIEIPKHMQLDSFKYAAEALSRFPDDYNEAGDFMCRMIKKKYNENWSCIIGTDFGFSVESEPGKYMHFNVGNVNKISIIAFMARN